jgi:hypothetical protein
MRVRHGNGGAGKAGKRGDVRNLLQYLVVHAG